MITPVSVPDGAQVSQPPAPDAPASGGRFALFLAGGGALLLVAAGAALWWREGSGIFTQVLLGGMALCN